MHFYFDTDDGGQRVVDNLGLALRDDREAIEQAVALLRDLSHARMEPGSPRHFAVRVRGADGADLYAAALDLRIDRLG